MQSHLHSFDEWRQAHRRAVEAERALFEKLRCGEETPGDLVHAAAVRAEASRLLDVMLRDMERSAQSLRHHVFRKAASP